MADESLFRWRNNLFVALADFWKSGPPGFEPKNPWKKAITLANTRRRSPNAYFVMQKVGKPIVFYFLKKFLFKSIILLFSLKDETDNPENKDSFKPSVVGWQNQI